MSELFEENIEKKTEINSESNAAPSETEKKSEPSAMSLDDRKQQLESKINKEMGDTPKPSSDGAKVKTQTKIKSPYDSPPTTGYNYNAPGTRMPLPKMSNNPPTTGSSYDVYNNYYNRPTNPNLGVAPKPEQNAAYSPYAAQTPKQKTNGALKSYLIIIVSITVIFLIGFIVECVNTYNQDGIFGGENGLFSKDFDKYLDSDYDFGFKFDDDDSDEDEQDTDSDSVFDFIDKDDTDNKSMKQAPDEKTVVNKSAANIVVADQPDDIDSTDYTAKKAYQRVKDSVVNVMVYDGTIGNEDAVSGSGSGIIISEDGYIITNSHVINDSKLYGVEIITNDGDSYIAVVVGYDARTDLAVLKIDGENLTAVEFVNSDQIEVGQDAIAVGNPGGIDYSNSLTRGCVSALNRTVSSNKLVPYIQTDAAINPGNSGGPLLNSAGQVMGINTIKIANSDYEGMGFAIPSNTVVSIANDLIGQGYVSNRVRMGITGIEVKEDILNGVPAGIRINEFAEDSPFSGSDAEIGDYITKVDGQDTTTFTQLFSMLDNYNPGDVVTVTLYRGASSTTNSKTFDVKIRLVADTGETQK